ncbi:hypothetical protein [Kribbella catacumbae]|uniref:hypothetical protein n=1 Tax=Kribbella catacumbae TaxID=460086 RepID=UPI0003729555|nr:hypothetical protein [Kribbella catacumbae]
MIDITEPLARLAGEGAPIWTSDVASVLAAKLARSVDGALDWDEDAGEEWLSVLTDGIRVAALSARLRLVLTIEGVPLESVAGQDVIAIVVPSFDDPILRSDLSALANAFGGEQMFRTLDTEKFSANDLWFATV